MVDIISFVKGLISDKNKMQFISDNIYSQIYKLLSRKYKTLGTNNANYHLDEYFYLVAQAVNEYNYSDIRTSDIVLDIGAAMGGFTLEIYNRVDHVYAVEPLFTEELSANIKLNHAKNIAVFDCALGESNTTQQITFVDKTIKASCKSLTEIINLCGGHVDVLKVDCEGGEWCIQPHELNGIRRIEGEIHSFNGENKDDFVIMLRHAGYDVAVKSRSKTTMLISAIKRKTT